MVVIDSPTARVLPLRQTPPKAHIIHTTGETDLDKILRFYQSPDGFQPHLMIETIGTVRRIVADDHVAYHAKIDAHEAHLYQLGYAEWSRWVWKNEQPVHVGYEWPGYFEWRQSWQGRGFASPLNLITGEHPNNASIGIELQQPVYPTPDIFTDEQYATLADLLIDSGKRNRIPLDREHTLGHYDVSPMRRSTAHGNWDPGYAFKWNRLWDLLRKRGAGKLG